MSFVADVRHISMTSPSTCRKIKYSSRSDTPGSCPTSDHRWSATQARLLAPHMIRVNSIHPTTVDTPMVQNPALYEVFGMPGASREQVAEAFKPLNSLPIPWVDPIDISNAVLFLASDESRYVTGLTMTVDAAPPLPTRHHPRPVRTGSDIR